MSKEMFLGVLREHLKVLEDQEQQDILQEYAQHIDIKMQNGLSEEEAIRDFGPVKELAAEILEAYHVKPEFGEPFEETRQKRGIVRVGRSGGFRGRQGCASGGKLCEGKGDGARKSDEDIWKKDKGRL